MTLSRRISRNRRHETAIYAGLAKFEIDARCDTDPERSKERMRILAKVREFALHVKEADLDKAWAFLVESRKGYDPKVSGLSDLMSAVDDWKALDEIASETTTIDARPAIEWELGERTSAERTITLNAEEKPLDEFKNGGSWGGEIRQPNATESGGRWIALCGECRAKVEDPDHTEECCMGHGGERPCEACGKPFLGQCIPRRTYDEKQETKGTTATKE